MTVIFDAKSVGRVVKLDGPLIAGSVQRGRLLSLARSGSETSRLGDDFAKFKAIFTAVNISEQTNVQFQHTLGDAIYLVVFVNIVYISLMLGCVVLLVCVFGS